MTGRERLIILTVLLVVVVGYATALVVKFVGSTLAFEEFKGEIAVLMAFLAGLLIKLPATAQENAEVVSDNVEVNAPID